jgi:hypothetical protein
VSTIQGQKRPDLTCIDVIRATFPMGSMTGAPKRRSLVLLDELEGDARGIYSGALGFFSLNGAVHFSVAIRTAVVTGVFLCVLCVQSRAWCHLCMCVIVNVLYFALGRLHAQSNPMSKAPFLSSLLSPLSLSLARSLQTKVLRSAPEERSQSSLIRKTSGMKCCSRPQRSSRVHMLLLQAGCLLFLPLPVAAWWRRLRVWCHKGLRCGKMGSLST